jgi:hypothetical protein
MVRGVASLAHSVLWETRTPLPKFLTSVITADIGANVSGSVVHYPHIEAEGGEDDESL